MQTGACVWVAMHSTRATRGVELFLARTHTFTRASPPYTFRGVTEGSTVECFASVISSFFYACTF